MQFHFCLLSKTSGPSLGLCYIQPYEASESFHTVFLFSPSTHYLGIGRFVTTAVAQNLIKQKL